MYRLEFELPGLPPTTNGAHGHWRTAHASRSKWRDAVRWLVTSKRPEKPLERVKLTLTRHSSKRTDYDNRVISFKSVIDGLKDALVILDDTDEVIVERKYLWEKAPNRKGKISVIVEESA